MKRRRPFIEFFFSNLVELIPSLAWWGFRKYLFHYLFSIFFVWSVDIVRILISTSIIDIDTDLSYI